jgi:DNA repair and recombination protein RAD52
MFNDSQIQQLSKAIDQQRVKTREKAGISLQYLETYDVINEANRIFNYMWNYTITRLEEVVRETNQNGNHVVTFSAIVKVKIFDSNGNFIEREDTGVGIGTARTIGDAIDNASKSSVSDSLKRSLRSMGASFGNDLYSKTTPLVQQNNHNQNYNHPQNNQQSYQNQNTQMNNQGFDRYEFQSLYNLGLDVVEQNGYLVVVGDNQYAFRDSIKALSFKFSPKSKRWYRQLNDQRAA